MEQPPAFRETKHVVYTRGAPPNAFLAELLEWGKTAPDEIFAPNDNAHDVYAAVKNELGPYEGGSYRRAVMLEVLMVLAGFESSWHWNEGVDTTNHSSVTPDTIEAGAWQVSANSRNFGNDLKAIAPKDGNEFQKAMKTNHPLAMEYIARLLRHTIAHNGPVLRHEINRHLSRNAVKEWQELLA